MEDRIAMVTGGRHGARVAVVDRDPDAVIGDVSRDEDCRRAVDETVERFGGLDTLVNNVASGDRAGLFDVTPERWDELITLSLTTAWLMIRHAVPAMTASGRPVSETAGGGAVVNISSVAAQGRGPGSVYGVAKAGLENLTKGAASLLGPQGIRVNCVQLGAIWTAMAAREHRRRSVALRTEGTSWDAAYAALFLASDRARWISGHVLTVEGGGLYRGPMHDPQGTPEERRP
ncbi:MAG: SDR family oxidoreductase [Streptosporangiales bacterium]|nr:SDR family oxidoreductase [Streptosporangiales bacterium]